MKYVSHTTVYCGYTRYARVSHSRQWYNYNLLLVSIGRFVSLRMGLLKKVLGELNFNEFLPHDAAQIAVVPPYFVCLSVCLTNSLRKLR